MSDKMEENIKIENAIIDRMELGEEHGCLTLWFYLKGEKDTYLTYGGYNLGHWFVLDELNHAGAIICNILQTFGIDKYESLWHTHVRVKLTNGGNVTAIGHFFNDRWFSFDEYFVKYPIEKER